MSNNVKLTVLACLAIALPGCRGLWTALGVTAAAGAGAAAVYYAKGDLEADFDDDLNDVYGASVGVLTDRGYLVNDTDSKIEGNEADVEATIPAIGAEDARDVSIHLEQEGGRTSISIRIGVFGDEGLSREILSGIEARLPGPG